MAGLTSRGLALALVLTAVAGVVSAPTGVAPDPTPAPTDARPPTCSERFPGEGPAGVDLRLGCIVSEVVGLYTASNRGDPPRLSAYVLVLAGGTGVGILLVALALRLLGRRAGRRLAPVLPDEWWVCPRCHSVNGAGVARCYACGGPPGDGPTLPTVARPETPQSSGGSPGA